MTKRRFLRGLVAAVAGDEDGAAPARARLDPIDLALLRELLADGRAAQEELSRRVALSRPAIAGRMRRLEECGVIRRYTVVLDWQLLGYPLLAFVWIRTTGGNCREHAQKVVQLADHSVTIEECHRVTGDWCLLSKVRARSSEALERFIDRLRELPHVYATMTTLSLSNTPP